MDTIYEASSEELSLSRKPYYNNTNNKANIDITPEYSSDEFDAIQEDIADNTNTNNEEVINDKTSSAIYTDTSSRVEEEFKQIRQDYIDTSNNEKYHNLIQQLQSKQATEAINKLINRLNTPNKKTDNKALVNNNNSPQLKLPTELVNKLINQINGNTNNIKTNQIKQQQVQQQNRVKLQDITNKSLINRNVPVQLNENSCGLLHKLCYSTEYNKYKNKDVIDPNNPLEIQFKSQLTKPNYKYYRYEQTKLTNVHNNMYNNNCKLDPNYKYKYIQFDDERLLLQTELKLKNLHGQFKQQLKQVHRANQANDSRTD